MDETLPSAELGDRSPKRFKKERERNVSEEASEDENIRRWEELPVNCLVEVFKRLSLDDMSLGVPFVCKWWYEASLDPACWKTLDFRAIDSREGSPFAKRFKHAYYVEKFTVRGFLKFIISRGHNSATKLILSKSHLPLRDLVYVCKQCPLLNISTAWDAEGYSETRIRDLVLTIDEATMKFACNL